MTDDPIMLNDWHVVANVNDVPEGGKIATQLLERDLLLWRSNGQLHAWLDRCPHRGSKLSLGEIRGGDTLVCPYHGWHFNSAGQCTLMPAHPQQPISGRARVTTLQVREKYGLVWVCLGDPAGEAPEFHGVDEDYHLVITGPYDVATSGPRAVENFLDLSHFPFVHSGYLGEEPYTEMDDYEVAVVDNEIRVTNVSAWQPRANVNSAGGVKVAYSYRVLQPLTVMLTKEPGAAGEQPSDLILLSIQPLAETRIRAWFVLAMNYGHDEPEAYFRDFQDTIFLQDQAVLESQRPQCLPLNPTAELHQPADKSSNAYRRWLKELGLRYGTC
ncbi:MAG: aromatic ring-hydroxylating dioxygenase subunit alpha [Gammaproteobacteria bacterium]|nr:aromatic ring-hydroxylating dioxygenase subunit alpha [Gammaproteobacteria bacterium]MCY4283407.1 aromatic ring-hydroxylating dioxygenase subunit alpha [Gammaproteobacteria bacterium]